MKHSSKCHSAIRPDVELSRDILGGRLGTWAIKLQEDLEPLSRPRIFGYALWRKEWVKVSSELVQDCRFWGPSYWGNLIDNAGFTRPGECRNKQKQLNLPFLHRLYVGGTFLLLWAVGEALSLIS